ncbi:hypothetical protein ACF1A5_05635 [Streptomyces sp. NPDC014864]|uniref:effector-associated constant component EACC1 n=1 Tax=Streptomyces sp. NPDC014864 TaxID=3364924 RepID=UPI0036F5D92E
MHIKIAVAADDSTVIHDLYYWFRQDEDIRRHAEIRLQPPPQASGTMGAVEIIDMVFNHGFNLANLALGYATWRATRPAAPPVTITVDDVSVTLRNGSEDEVRRIVNLLRPASPAGSTEDSGARQHQGQTASGDDR